MTKMSFVSSEMFPRERLSGYWLCGRAWVGWIVCCWCNDCINLLNIIAICCLALKQRDFVAACTREERLKQCTVAVRRLTNEAIKVEETQPRRNAKKRKRERERRDWWNLNDRATLCQLLVHRVINLKTCFTVFISRKNPSPYLPEMVVANMWFHLLIVWENCATLPPRAFLQYFGLERE